MILESIHNHYEKLVVDEALLQQAEVEIDLEEGTLKDVVCVALNNLPARYVRHSIDIAFYLTIPEREQMDKLVCSAVAGAFELVAQNPRED